MNIDLATLRSEIQQYLDSSGFAVFHSHVGALETFSTITWNTEAWPDYRVFLDTAKKSGAGMILFASRDFEEEEVLEAVDEMDSMQLERDDRRELEAKFKTAKRHVGDVCSLELSFSHGTQMYVYEVRPDWYDEFLDAVEEIETLFAGGDDEDHGSDGLGGFYSNN